MLAPARQPAWWTEAEAISNPMIEPYAEAVEKSHVTNQSLTRRSIYPKPASTNLQEKQVTTYIQKFRQTFKAPFTEPHSQGLVEKRHDTHHPLECFYTDTERKKGRKKVFILDIWTHVEVQDEELVKCLIRSKMEARVKVSVRFSWKFSQKMIQKSRSKREEASFFIVVFIHLLFISICCESPPDVALHAQSLSWISKFHENVRCYEAPKLYIWLAMRWQDGAWLACKRGIPLPLYEGSI